MPQYMMTPNELQEAVSEAIRKGKIAAVSAIPTAGDEQREHIRAGEILLEIPRKVEEAVKEGRGQVVAMYVRAEGWSTPPAPNEVGHDGMVFPSRLQGEAALVFKACTNAGLNPTLRFASGSEKGIDFAITIYW